MRPIPRANEQRPLPGASAPHAGAGDGFWGWAHRRALALALGLEPRPILLVALPLIAVFALIASRALFEPPAILDASRELNELSLPTALEAMALAAAGGLGLLAGALLRERGAESWGPTALGAVLLFMGFDEAATVHERPEELTDLPWQLFYAPIFLIAALAWAKTASLCTRGARAALVFAAGGWLLAVSVLEELEYRGTGPEKVRADGYFTLVAIEEALEMAATVAFGIALLGLVQALARAPSPPLAGTGGEPR